MPKGLRVRVPLPAPTLKNNIMSKKIKPRGARVFLHKLKEPQRRAEAEVLRKERIEKEKENKIIDTSSGTAANKATPARGRVLGTGSITSVILLGAMLSLNEKR